MTEELLNALKLIKDECNKHGSCSKCPLRNPRNDCGVTTASTPSTWSLEKNEVYF